MTATVSKPGVESHAGVDYMRDAKGHLVPLAAVKAHEKLEDELVRDIVARAQAKSAEIREFREGLFSELDSFNGLLDEHYGVRARGVKGNQTFTTYDGLLRVQLATADTIEFGAGLQQAKALIDECLKDWSEGGRMELVTLVTRAFNVDADGRVNAKELLALKRYDFDDERWKRAMGAIDDSIRVTGSKRFIRFACRSRPDDKWVNIPLNIAVA